MKKTTINIDVIVNFKDNVLTTIVTKKNKLFDKFFVVEGDSGGFTRIEREGHKFYLCNYLRKSVKDARDQKLISKIVISLTDARNLIKTAVTDREERNI